LSNIVCPVLFTASLQDQALQSVGDQLGRMSAQIPGSQLFMVNGGDHPLMWSRPELFRSVCDLFLASL
jgi:pimeloyl-ACP methyl ester carboxylesterase